MMAWLGGIELVLCSYTTILSQNVNRSLAMRDYTRVTPHSSKGTTSRHAEKRTWAMAQDKHAYSPLPCFSTSQGSMTCSYTASSRRCT